MPTGWEPTIPPAPSVSVVAGESYYVRTTTTSADGSYFYSDGNGFTIFLITPPQTGKLKSPVVYPSEEPKYCQTVTQQQIDGMSTSPGRTRMFSASVDHAYYEGSLINRIETRSAVTSLAPFGTVSLTTERYYRRCITIDHPGFENPGYPGTYWFGPTIGGREFSLMPAAIYNPYYYLPNKAEGYNWKFLEWELISRTVVELVKCGSNQPVFSPSSSPIFNPPLRKKRMNNECCQILALYHQEQLRLMGRPLGPQGQLIQIPENTYFNTEVERVKTPIENIKEPEKEKIKFSNFYELLMYGLTQQINLDVGVDPKSFVPPTGKVQNPEYQRDSEESLKNNNQPETDKAGNKRELEIGNQIKINSLSQQSQYSFDALRRLEYLFPSGELGDAKFKKSLIIPGAEEEFLIQFLNATLGNPKIPIKIEDTNAIKEGNQTATFNHFSISHMIREIYRLILESGDDINAIMETTVRDFRTNLANRIQIVQIAEMAQALVEDTGMLEAQEFIKLKLDGDPYAGKWKPGMGFEPDGDLDSNEEKATEKLMQATLKNFEAQVKVIRRDKRENADIRDLLLQLSEMFVRSSSIPATKEGIEKALAAAKFKVKVDNALSRTQVKRAAAAKLARTKKRKK
jgi:hypothetical protein